MIILGIESTAHTFGVGIVTDKGKVLSNVKDSFTTESGGIVPYQASRHHVDCCDEVLEQALKEAKIKLKDVSLISFSQSPGIGHCLRIGAMVARTLALKLNKPIVGINHCIAHLEIGRLLTKAKDPVLLYVSGANTQVIAYEGKKYRIFGETLDIGVGNFLDCLAREMGLGFPGGPKISKLADGGKDYIELPYVVKGMDVSFGGLLTNLKQKIKTNNHTNEDIAYSAQETVFAMLLEVAERALFHCQKKELLLGGGVACNNRLKEMAEEMCKSNGMKCFVPENQFLVDNAAMIAWQGYLEYNAGKRTKVKDAGINPYERTDDVKVNWR
jgi:N6-L-threonylcarbamoyladenine synthase